MRIIPKKIKVKNTVWKCYSMADVIVALIVFAIIFIAITSGAFAFAVIMGLLAVVMFMPTQDGIFYSCILENIKFLFAKKVYTENADKQKERVDALLNLKNIKENGLIEYSGGYFGRVIKVGQKNFGIEDVVQQNIDIDYLANALKMLDGTQCADIIKIDRPVNLDNFAQDLFGRLAEMKESVDEEEVREIKTAILRERIDRIDKMNNIRKQYLSDYYAVTGEDDTLEMYAIEKQLKTLSGIMDETMELAASSTGDGKRFQEEMKSLSSQMVVLREQLEIIKGRIDSNKKVNEEIENIKQCLSADSLDFSEYNDVTIRRRVEYIRVMKDNSIIIVLKGGMKIQENI